MRWEDPWVLPANVHAPLTEDERQVRRARVDSGQPEPLMLVELLLIPSMFIGIGGECCDPWTKGARRPIPVPRSC